MRYRTVIIDDEKPALDEMIFLLEAYPQIEIVGTASDGNRGLEVILEQRPDLVFLDIEMPLMDGLEVAHKLYKLRDLIQPVIIFTTAYDQFAIKAFEVEARDYLLKPISEDRLKAALDRLPERWISVKASEGACKIEGTCKGVTKVPVEYKGRYKMVSSENILYFTTESGEVTAKTQQGSYSVKTSLSELEEALKDQSFFRCHRGFIVNLNHVAEVVPWFKGKYLLIMDDSEKSEVPVSRTYIKGLCEILKLK